MQAPLLLRAIMCTDRRRVWKGGGSEAQRGTARQGWARPPAVGPACWVGSAKAAGRLVMRAAERRHGLDDCPRPGPRVFQ